MRVQEERICRFIAPCVTEGCHGNLRVGTNAASVVISCKRCGANWPKNQWLLLGDLIATRDAKEASHGEV